MYKTPDGIRVLQGAERQLVVESLGMIVDQLTDFDFLSEIAVLDDLTRNQRIAVYHAAARSLLAEDEPPPALTAVLEAAVASIYRFAGDMISQEVRELGEELGDGELPVRPSWRELATAAGREVGGEDLPGLDEQKSNDWDLLIICLQDHVLWDDDFEMLDHLDAAPELARRVKRKLGIADDYFVAIPPDPSDADAERLLAELLTLTGDAR